MKLRRTKKTVPFLGHPVNDICSGVENGGEITIWNLKAELIDVSRQLSIDKVLFDDSIVGNIRS